MAAARKPSLPRVLDLPMLVASALTVLYYLFIAQESLKDTMIARYTSEHAVEYVIVWFFIWGVTDVVFRACGFPSEMLALKQSWLPARGAREPVAHATVHLATLQKKPAWLQESRMGRRIAGALAYLKEQGSAGELKDHLRYLADLDEEDAHARYALVRFICWVTPMLGFLGTVVHFGTALGGQEAADLGDKLPTVVAEMGTAFNTTTVALIAATSMMFCLFLCERTDRGILHTIDRRAERELLHRFETADANMAPMLAALEAAGQANLQAMDATLERQLQIWSGAFDALAEQSQLRNEQQAALWEQALARVAIQFEEHDGKRDERLVAVLDSMRSERELQRGEVRTSLEQIGALQADFARLVAGLTAVAESKGEIVKLQAVLADNLRLLRETQQIDEALHGLSAAIHLLTARGNATSFKEHRAA
ncbi:MAG: MotA/TolQ/ExbB proton channel family protein [Pirellulales bacterium]